MKRGFLIGSLTSINFSIRAAKIDRSRTNFSEFLFHFMIEINSFLYKVKIPLLDFWEIILVQCPEKEERNINIIRECGTTRSQYDVTKQFNIDKRRQALKTPTSIC